MTNMEDSFTNLIILQNGFCTDVGGDSSGMSGEEGHEADESCRTCPSLNYCFALLSNLGKASGIQRGLFSSFMFSINTFACRQETVVRTKSRY